LGLNQQELEAYSSVPSSAKFNNARNLTPFHHISSSRSCKERAIIIIMSRAKFGNCVGIYYQHVRGLRTKQLEIYDNVCATDFNIICLTETCLNDSCYDHNLFPNGYTLYQSDWPYTNKARGGGVLTAIASSLGSSSRRYDL
jgi:hypothetical protein